MPRNAPARTAFETLPDYGYVPGCHVIRNGYHCDIPHNETAP
jgi:rubredoxin